MGAFLEKPKTEKLLGAGEGNGLRYGVCCMQGWRVEMEDAHVTKCELQPPFERWSYFGVFDGHAGYRCAEICAEKLLDSILETEEFQKLGKSESDQLDIPLMKSGIVNGFLSFDQELALIDTKEKSGSTAVITFITPTHIVMANCGDSRAILIRDNEPVLATLDHKPCDPVEHKRISEAGGRVVLARVNGSLAVSRSLGDFEYKQICSRAPTQQLVSPEPDVFVIERKKDLDQILVLACDGVWDVFDNDNLTEYVLQRLSCVSSLVDICSEILDTSLHKGSRDNMSVLLVALDGVPSVNSELARKDAELNTAIESVINELIDSMREDTDSLTVESVANFVKSRNLPNYPPGGFIAKRGFIDNLFNNHIGQGK